MKALKWVILGLLIVIVFGGLIVYFNINRIVRRTVESQATSSLNLTTTLQRANLSLFGGKLSLDELDIASPKGFSAPAMFTLDEVAVAVKYGELKGDPVRIQEIKIDEPRLVIEQSGGKFNFQAAMDGLPKTEEKPSDGKREEGEEIKLIIDHLQVTNATVVMRPGLPGLTQEIEVKIPTLDLNNIGSGEGNQNGAAIKEVVMQVITALVAKAGDAENIGDQLKQQLNAKVTEVAGQISKEFNTRLDKISEDLGKKLPPELGTAVGDILNDPKIRENDPGKKIEEGLNDLLGGDKDKKRDRKSTTAPATQPRG